GVGDGQQSLLVELPAALEPVGELVARSAGAPPQPIAALDHELLDAAVEDRPVVERLPGLLLPGGRVGPLLLPGGQAHEVLHRLRGVLGEELHHHLALGGVEGCVQILSRPDLVQHRHVIAPRPVVRITSWWSVPSRRGSPSAAPPAPPDGCCPWSSPARWPPPPDTPRPPLRRWCACH